MSQITNLPRRALQSVQTTSLTFDLTSDQEKRPRNRKKTFTGKKREEPFRRATEEDPSPGWTDE